MPHLGRLAGRGSLCRFAIPVSRFRFPGPPFMPVAPYRRKTRLLSRGFAALATLWLIAGSAAALDPGDVRVEIGLAGCVKTGRWAPVTVAVRGQAVKAAAVEAVDPHGDLVRFPLKARPRPFGGFDRAFGGLFRIGRLQSVPSLVLKLEDGTERTRRVTLRKDDDSTGEMWAAMRQTVLIVATSGKPAGFDSLREALQETGDSRARQRAGSDADTVRVLPFERPEQFPIDVRGYDAMDAVVLTGPYRLDAERNAALREWVREGGHLIVCRGTDLDAFHAKTRRRAIGATIGAPAGLAVAARTQREAARRAKGDALLAEWLPVTILGEIRVPDLVGVESFVGQRAPILFSGRAPAAQLLSPRSEPYASGMVLADGPGGPLIVEAPFGAGRVTFCALNLNEPPLSAWKAVDGLGRRLLERELETARSARRPSGGRLSHSGVTDLSTQLHAVQESFPDVRRMSAWKTMGLLLCYVLLIGPLDYLLVHRVLKRPRLTWVTFPLFVAAAALLAVYNAGKLNGERLQVNALTIVDVDATAGTSGAVLSTRQNVQVTSWLTLYSPQTRRYGLIVEPRSLVGPEGTPDAPAIRSGPESVGDASDERFRVSPALGWSGVPETVFGGMYRQGGLNIGRLSYGLRPGELAVDGLPIRLWSAKTLSATWRYAPVPLIESRLVRNEFGRLSGELTHRFRGSIRDWMVVYGSYVYAPSDTNRRGPAQSIPPGVAWSLRQEGIEQRGLTDVLSGAYGRGAKTGGESETRSVGRPEYDAAGRNRFGLLQTISFYRRMGGKKYTGLDNIPLGRFDLSGLLGMNRAILIGRLDRPAVGLMQVGESGGERSELKPTRSDTFVRIVLPVLRSPSE